MGETAVKDHTRNGLETMPRMPLRPFRLSDALLLVAATALGLAWCRFLNAHSQIDGVDPTVSVGFGPL